MFKKHALLACLAFGAASGTAIAENWAGATVGAFAGHVSHENKGHGSSFNDTTPGALWAWSRTNREETDERFFGGLKAGYDWQSGNYVYGVIADLAFTNTSRSSGHLDSGNYSYHREDKMDWLATVRGRFGIDVNGFLPYVTGGLALANIKNNHQTITCCPTIYESNKDDIRYGWVLGAGVEKKVTNALSVSFEGLYAAFPKKGGDNRNFASVTGDTVAAFASDVKVCNKAVLLNLGINYKF